MKKTMKIKENFDFWLTSVYKVHIIITNSNDNCYNKEENLNMKKLVLLLVSFLALATLTACGTSAPAGKVTVGVTSMNGDFIAGFSNSAYDRIVRDMIWGYATYDYTPDGEFVLDKQVVKKEEATVNEDGSKTYKFEINKDLKWSDETAITAKDYVFGILLGNSAAWGETAAGGNFANMEIKGWDEYSSGKSETFEGVELIDDYTFSMTIKAEELPYFYEVAFVAVAPSPLHAFAKGADIEVGKAKVTFGEAKDMASIVKHVATKERFAPTVTSGMYNFVSYENEAALVEVNPNFKGDYRGKKPTVKNVEVKRINTELEVEYIASGEIDIATGVVEGTKIEAIKAMKEEGKADFTTYERNGYGYMSFHNDFGPVADKTVRHAIGRLVDRNVFVEQILGGYGVVVNGMYGLGQWMYKDNAAKVEADLVNYVYNVEEANELLDTTEWKFEKDGKTAFDASKAGKDYLRHNSEGVALQINHAGTEENPITDLILNDVTPRMNKAGIGFSVDYYDFATMYGYFNQPKTQEAALGARKYHSFNLATSFTAVFDPYTSLHSDYFGTSSNNEQVKDEKFDELIMNMRRIDSSDRDAYSKAWLEFQKYWNEYLPQIPLYSNQYYDIYGAQLKDVNTTGFYGIGRAIIDVKLK